MPDTLCLQEKEVRDKQDNLLGTQKVEVTKTDITELLNSLGNPATPEERTAALVSAGYTADQVSKMDAAGFFS